MGSLRPEEDAYPDLETYTEELEEYCDAIEETLKESLEYIKQMTYEPEFGIDLFESDLESFEKKVRTLLGIQITHTFDEWSKMGYKIIKGSKAVWVDDVAHFNENQVEKVEW